MKSVIFRMVIALLPFSWLIADPYIYIRVSLKVILDPATGQRPYWADDSDLQNEFNSINNLMFEYGRGYRFTVTDITEVGWQGGYNSGPSQYYYTNFFEEPDEQHDMEEEAMTNPQYAWNSNAINIYLQDGIVGGSCAFPSQDDEIIIIGGGPSFETYLHEIGHYFNLCHTQECPCGCECNDDCNACGNESDDVFDTLLDWPSWDEDEIAIINFGTTYNNLSASQQSQVDNVFHNIMSYHRSYCDPPDEVAYSEFVDELTEGQLDKWADAMDGYDSRRLVRTGDSYFPYSFDFAPFFPQNFNSAINEISDKFSNGYTGVDIIYLSNDEYHIQDNTFINFPVIIYATRQGAGILK